MNTAEITTPAKGLTNALSERSRAQRRNRKNLVALETVASAPRRNDLLPQIKLESRALFSLHAPTRAIRQVRPEHIAEIAHSMSVFGVVNPILITADGKIIDGVSSVEAARTIGLGIMPCVVIDHLKPEEIRLLRLALNRLGEKGRWDLDELQIEFQELLDIGVPVEVTGFTLPEIDIVTMYDGTVVDQAANNVPAVIADAPAVSKLGDVWKLGRHRLLCADATKPESYTRLFEGVPLARAVFTDPPYNIQIDGFAVGAGSIKHREFVAASGEMTDDEFDTFLAEFLKAASAQLADGGILFVCMDWRHAEHVQRAARRAELFHVNTVVWSKGNGGLGGLYRSAHEFVLILKKGGGASVNNVELEAMLTEESNGLLHHLQNIRGKLYVAFDNAIEAGDRTASALLAGRLLENLRFLSELTGRLQKYTTPNNVTNINILASPQFLNMQAHLIQALAPFPDARRAVIQAFRQMDEATPLPPPHIIEGTCADAA